jgi:hypothetical protein
MVQPRRETLIPHGAMLQLQCLLIVRGDTGYKPARYGFFWGWPKTLSETAVSEARFWAFSLCSWHWRIGILFGQVSATFARITDSDGVRFVVAESVSSSSTFDSGTFEQYF